MKASISYRIHHRAKRLTALLLVFCALTSCTRQSPWASGADRLVPAEEFSKSVKNGEAADYSIFRAANRIDQERRGRLGASDTLPEARSEIQPDRRTTPSLTPNVRGGSTKGGAVKGNPEKDGKATEPGGDQRYLRQGFKLKKSYGPPMVVHDRAADPNDGYGAVNSESSAAAQVVVSVRPVPPGSSAPYAYGQMTGNPSLWPDEGEAATLFRDFRAFKPMDVITIGINESTEGKKKAETDAKSEFSISAAINNLFGIETKSWASNNEGFDAENIINAATQSDFKGEGETKRKGTLKGRLSAVIMEVLPNGLLRIEGTKIVSVDNEEEIMVLSGLARERDIDAQNTIDSSRIANMRIDFYGRGIIADQQEYGWLSGIIRKVWPF